jgi:sulfatase maturation enzyme AslB (radical SAM superfamily)
METSAERVIDLSGLIASESLRYVPSDSSERGLLYDSLRGQGLVVSPAVWRLLQAVQRGENVTPLLERLPDPVPLLQPLFEHGHLRRAGAPSRPQVPLRDLSSGYLVQDLRLTIIESCNFSCTYCYADTTTGRVMSWDTARTAIDRFVELQRRHGRKRAKFKFFGGEPLMNWPLVQQVLEYLASPDLADIQFVKSLNTNAALLDSAKRETLVRHGVKLQVSLDGVPEVNDHHYSMGSKIHRPWRTVHGPPRQLRPRVPPGRPRSKRWPRRDPAGPWATPR